MKIAVVIANGYTMGGTVRTVYNLARGLSERHEVEIVSLTRRRRDPFFTLPEGVRLWPLHDRTAEAPAMSSFARRRWTRRVRSVVPESELARNQNFTPESVSGLHRFLRTTDADVVMGTRPGINLLLAAWAPKRLCVIGQEHLNLGEHKPDLVEAIDRRYRDLDGLSVLTESDRNAYTRLLRRGGDFLTVVPNAVDPGVPPRSTLDAPVIAAAGRLSPVKQYPKLVEAFAQVVEEHPEWCLRIYGDGDKAAKIEETARKHGIEDNVRLMGQTRDLTEELSKASILAVSSKVEGFGMTIVEAFSVGLPVVSFDCPHGPGEIIEHERTGLLVPPQDTPALGRALLRLVEDRERRHHMGEQALEASSRYRLEDIIPRWESFLEHHRA
ncbi:glycosyltransferase family 4 protein [Nocardiopsis sp. MG754419]|uniref:glycosyltransferase family 4 protein n=1 Tax=Nocardiopsis sp. MG754419 TaxID=2259865 RepID=UPI001BAAAF84|nr:glycosyltransferase family 4 protein [Nocardiopsis sp. MG754419]MBR8743994.1 glycosyltransferase family 4 protein [Nocardiopsis sp. MG754419]